jgi:predicted nucleic acid-binding protein
VKLFIDTWGWLTLRDRRETRHRQVVDYYHDLRRLRGIVYTSDYVLDETITLLFRRLPFDIARESLEHIQEAVTQGYLRLELVTPDRFAESVGLRLRFQDKPRISFTDLTSMVIMSRCQIDNVLTEDDHFHQVGMGFKKVP